MDCRLAKVCMVRLALRFPSLRPIKRAMDVIRPPGFHLHNHMSRQPFGTLQKEGAQDRHEHEKATLLAQRSGIFDRCKEFTRCATHLQNLHTMITIRSSAASSEPTLIGVEVILTTPRGTYMISSNSTVAHFSSPFGGGLFGAISWPRSQFRLAPGIVLDQQMFFPNDGSAAAFSWQLHTQSSLQARLTVKPFFSGCGPRSYRDVGFHFDSEEDGGRLTWLPNVRGPKISADTNGRYHDEPVRLFDCLCEQAAASALEEDLVTPGRFEFELGRRPSVLIFSIEGLANAQRDQHVGVFLAGLMQENSPARSGSSIAESVGTPTQQLAAARSALKHISPS